LLRGIEQMLVIEMGMAGESVALIPSLELCRRSWMQTLGKAQRRRNGSRQ
jgi:hypothetical protein